MKVTWVAYGHYIFIYQAVISNCFHYPKEAVWRQLVLCCRLIIYRQISNISRTESQNWNILVSSCSCLFPFHWSQVLSREYGWTSATGDTPTTSEWSTVLLLTDVTYIRGLTLLHVIVVHCRDMVTWQPSREMMIIAMVFRKFFFSNHLLPKHGTFIKYRIYSNDKD